MSVTLIIIVVTGIASFYAWNNPEILAKWIFNPYRTHKNREYYRFITSGFIHNDYIHLFFNLFVLYMFGNTVERTFIAIYGDLGIVIFLALYLLGIIVADIPTFIKYKELPHYNALGASGGVSSVLFSFVFFMPLSELCLYGLSFLCFPGFVWAIIYMIYSYYMGKKAADNVNHDAHLFGAAFGIAFTALVYPPSIMNFIRQLSEFSGLG